MNPSVAQAIKDVKNNACSSVELKDKLDDGNILEILHALKTNKSVTALNISNNNLGGWRMHHLSKILRSNSSLLTLDISNTNMGNEMRHLCWALRANCSLTTLLIGNNNMRMQHLVELFRKNTSLTTMDISHNVVDTYIIRCGMRHLSSALRSNPSLSITTSGGGHRALQFFKYRNKCLLARDNIYIFLFYDAMMKHPLCDRMILLHALQFLLVRSNMVPLTLSA